MSPRNCTRAASTPIVVARARTVGLASANVADTRTAAGARRTALIANPHHVRINRLPPAANRSSTSAVGSSENVGVVEGASQQRVKHVVSNRQGDQENASRLLRSTFTKAAGAGPPPAFGCGPSEEP